MSNEPKESQKSASHEQCGCSGRCEKCQCRKDAKDAVKMPVTPLPALTGMVWLPALGAFVQ